MMSKLSGVKASEMEHANESQANDDASAPGLVKHQTHFQSLADWLINKGLDWKHFKPGFQVCSSFPDTQTQGAIIWTLDSYFKVWSIKSLKPSSCPGSNSCHGLHCYADDIQLNCPTQPKALWWHRPCLSSLSVIFYSHPWNINSDQSCLLSLEENVPIHLSSSPAGLISTLALLLMPSIHSGNSAHPPTSPPSSWSSAGFLSTNTQLVHPGSRAEPGPNPASRSSSTTIILPMTSGSLPPSENSRCQHGSS